MYSTGEHLTDAIKDNLKAKANEYMDRSPDDRHKVMIFTDNVPLWKDNANVIIRDDLPPPPIPADYDRTLANYDILDEMEKFIAEYVRPFYAWRNTHCNVYDSAGEDEDRPRPHVIFAPHSLESYVTVLLKSSTVRTKPVRRCRISDNVKVDPGASSVAASGGDSSSSTGHLHVDNPTGSGSGSRSSMSSEGSVCLGVSSSDMSISSEGSVSAGVSSSEGDGGKTSVVSGDGADQTSYAPVVVQRRIDPATDLPKIVVKGATIPGSGESVEGGETSAADQQQGSSTTVPSKQGSTEEDAREDDDDIGCRQL